MSRAERLQLIDWPDGDESSAYSIRAQAQLLDLNRSGLYYRPKVSAEEIALKHRIDELYTRYPFYGSRRVAAVLKREGLAVNRKAVQRQMREMGIQGIAPGPNSSRPHPGHRVYPYLLRGLSIERPNHVWGVDITYIRLLRGWAYLVAIVDWFSRYVVSWELDVSLERVFVVNALTRALEQARPEIVNSDQGSHFTSNEYIGLLQQAAVQISMDGRGRAHDNIFTERFWRSLKYEEVYLNEYASPREARIGISHYMSFYNHDRPHQALDDHTPAECYFAVR